jgi:protease-4
MRWLWLALFAPFWLPRWLLARARWRHGKRNTVQLVLRGALPDVANPRTLMNWFRPSPGPELLPLLEGLAAAGRDDRLHTIVVRIEELSCGLGRAEELRAALERARKAGKRVIVHADELGLSGYWIALGASSIHLSPTGTLDVAGVALQFTLLRGLLDRAGVRAQLLAQGKYKSMREMFTEQELSESNREMLSSLVGNLSEQLAQRVSSARHLPQQAAHQHIHEGPLHAADARQRGLIDSQQYWDELWEELGGEQHRVQSWSEYQRSLRRRRWPRRARQVGLLRISGNIRMGQDRPGPSGPRATGHRSLERALRRLVRSPRTGAIVVRVDSPGGSALASDLMWRELSRAARKKPLFVSMVDVAASGGFYTACMKGVPVWASPTTFTGSIGVVGGKFEASELLSKLGVRRASVMSGPHADFHSPTRPWLPEELAKLEHDLATLYRDFVSKMADGRGVSYEQLHAVAQGRVWTGKQAQEVALVDHLGGLHEVGAAVRERLGLPADASLDWTLVAAPSRFGAQRNAAEDLLGGLHGAFGDWQEWPGALELAMDLQGERLWALAPFLPGIRR